MEAGVCLTAYTTPDSSRSIGTPGRVFPSPEDWRDCPIYFLMVDRFNNSAKPPVHQPSTIQISTPIRAAPSRSVSEQLPYIKALGAGAIWLSPVLKNRINDEGCYHGYGIHDFLSANPRFASSAINADAELRALVDAAHTLGLYVIFDIVLNHTGDMFAYQGSGPTANFSPSPLPIGWRDATGAERDDWPAIENIAAPLPADALVWPKELQANAYFRRQGQPGPADDTVGDFASLKQMMTEKPEVQNALIRAYQYVIGRFDVDGFRIDTLRYLKERPAAYVWQRDPGIRPRNRQEEFLHLRRGVDRKFGARHRQFYRPQHEQQRRLVGVDAALDYPLLTPEIDRQRLHSPPQFRHRHVCLSKDR